MLLRSGLWSLVLLLGVPASMPDSGPHIADVNILLPPKMKNPVEYRLQGSGGCFQWSWDHHDVLSVIPEYNSSSHCSTSARLRSIAPYSGRKETAIYATDAHTGVVVRCKVFVDVFSRIRIFHNSIKLDLDGLSILRVRAFDNEDNVFSSLVGLQFMWHLMPEIDGWPHHLVHIPLEDSPLSDCGGLCGDLNVQIQIEERGVFSDLFVVKGVEIGHEIVSVRLLEPQFQYIEDKIVLTVVEAMSLDPPSPIFVLIGAVFQFGLKVIRGNIPQVVTLPSPHHRWFVLNSSVAQVDDAMGTTHALNLGATAITVEDTRVAGNIQTSSLHVVVPDSLYLYILPLSSSGDPMEGVSAVPSVARWYVISGHPYAILIKVFSRAPGAQEIYISENDDIKMHYPPEYWKAFLVSDSLVAKHGWRAYRILKARSHGPGKVTASLTYSNGRPETTEVLKVVQEVMVCEQVKLNFESGSSVSQSILLPWAPGVFQEVELMATGGCAKAVSDYKWLSSDLTIVSVSTTGVVQAKKPGKATIKVSSIFDPVNYDEVVIEVSIPSSMLMMKNLPVETVVGTYLRAAVTMKSLNGAYFYKCDALNPLIQWKVGSEVFIIINATGESSLFDNLEIAESLSSFSDPQCARSYLYASASGQASLHATLSKDYLQYGPIVLKTSARIAAYAPLKVCQAGDGNQFGGYSLNLSEVKADDDYSSNLVNLHLAPGSQIDVMLLGGPEPWDHSVEHLETAVNLDDKHNDVGGVDLLHQVPNNHQSLYRVFCEAPGNFALLFKRGNLVGDHHPVPSLVEVEVSLSCRLPSLIVIIVDEPVNAPDVLRRSTEAEHDAGLGHASTMTVTNGRTIRIAAAGISDTGQAFANSSSLDLGWELHGCEGLASWDRTYDREKSKSSWEMFLALQDRPGMCIVRATVTGFRGAMLDQHFIPLPFSEGGLSNVIRLQLVSALSIKPDSSLLLFSPHAKLNLSISGGSCFLEAFVNDSQVVEITQPSPSMQCSQLTLASKGRGTALVSVYDSGVTPLHAAHSLVEVAEIDWIKITAHEKIYLMEGSLNSFHLLAGVGDGRTFDSSQFVYINFFLHIKDHIVDLVDDGDSPSVGGDYFHGPTFIILAKDIGVTTLYVSARQQSGREILSQPIMVEVYTSPRIHPSRILLVPGAYYVLTLKGGPRIGANVVYSSMDDRAAKIHRLSGGLSAISPGNTTLIARIYGNGDDLICQTYAQVKIVVPSSMILNVQSVQLGVGCVMPIYPSLHEGDLFSFFGLCKDFKWSIEDDEVLSFQAATDFYGDIYGKKESKITGYMDVNDPINVVSGRSAGRTNVSVSFSCDFISSGSFSESRSYNASVSLWVISDLPFSLIAPMTWILPPHYTSSSLLPLSEVLSSQWDTQSHKGGISYSLLSACSQRHEDPIKAAIAIDGEKIKTTESNSLACIQASHQASGKIEVAACVRVAEVAQIRITSTNYPIHAIDLAVGVEVVLPIKYFDALGNPFLEAYDVISVDVQTNFPDILSISDSAGDSGNIRIKGARQGTALLRISMQGSLQKSDYMLISVGARLYPQNPVLNQGSSLNFSIEGVNDKVSGRWWSSNETVLYVDARYGKANAVGEGTTQVFFEGSGLALQTVVSVLKGDMIFVNSPQGVLTNVPFPLKGLNFSVMLSSHDQKFKAPGNSREILYDCRVDPHYIGYAVPWRDLDTGNSYCLFFPYSPEQLEHYVPISKDARPDVYISITASLREATHVSASASALFIGGFSIAGMGKDMLQFNFDPHYNKSVITIVGNTDVEIGWQNRDMLMITSKHIDAFGIGGRARYEVSVHGSQRFDDNVTIILPATGQKVELGVSYHPGGVEASTFGVDSSLWGVIVALLVLLMSTAGIFLFFLSTPRRTRPSSSRVSPGFQALATPDRQSPTTVNGLSPRTPPLPFMDYVRRTIDETPNYRHDSRRRFNPHGTL